MKKKNQSQSLQFIVSCRFAIEMDWTSSNTATRLLAWDFTRQCRLFVEKNVNGFSINSQTIIFRLITFFLNNKKFHSLSIDPSFTSYFVKYNSASQTTFLRTGEEWNNEEMFFIYQGIERNRGQQAANSFHVLFKCNSWDIEKFIHNRIHIWLLLMSAACRLIN